MELRPYQQELIDKLRASMKSGRKSICAVLGCGGGKSIIAAMIAKKINEKGNRVLFIVHRKELCDQIAKTFIACGVDMYLTQIGMVQTVCRRLDKTPEPAVIIIDEAHHVCANSYVSICEHFNRAFKIGFTATPTRLKDGGLGKFFEELIESVSTKWLIENNFLSPYKYYSHKLVDTSSLHIRRGDYAMDEVAGLMEKKKIYGDTIVNYQKYAAGKKTIVYCASVEASKATAKEFKINGFSAYHLDGTTNAAVREQAVADFRRGGIDILCNVDLFGEGKRQKPSMRK